MAKSKEQASISPETRDEALKIAMSTQKPGQTKEQTKLVAQGIQKGIALYKKQQKAKSRESDKKHKKAVREKSGQTTARLDSKGIQPKAKQSLVPWLLLISSWVLFGIYFLSVKA